MEEPLIISSCLELRLHFPLLKVSILLNGKGGSIEEAIWHTAQLLVPADTEINEQAGQI